MKDDLRRLIYRTVDGTVTAEEFDRLQDAILEDDEVRDEYLDVVAMSQTLRHVSAVDSAARSLADSDEVRPPSTDTQTVSKKQGNTQTRTTPQTLAASQKKSPTMTKWRLAAVMTMAASMIVAVAIRYSIQQHNAGTLLDQRVTLRDDMQSQVREASVNYVARITNVSPEVVWGPDSSDSEFLLRKVEGDSIDVRKGLVELEYYSAAKIILHGPCKFVTSGANSGRLEEGRITGRVAGEHFHLTTPTATVVDLGTELAVSLNHIAETDVHVFNGKVEVSPDASGESSQPTVSLTEGMSARISDHGTIEPTVMGSTESFVREFPNSLRSDPAELSLVDVVCATSLFDNNLSTAIGPDTGDPDRRPWQTPTGPGHRFASGLQETRWHPFIDSVFIPWLNGIETEIDSSGTLVDLPQCTGRTWGPIWARRKINDVQLNYRVKDFWGTLTLGVVMERLSQCDSGMIGLHANVGVTIDLNAIRQLDRRPTRFVGVVANLDNSAIKEADAPEWLEANRFSADFRIFVDGELRDSRLDFTRADGELEMIVDLDPEDRFLTFVSTDADSFDGFDHVVLIDPILETVAP
ncbi:hypothetical protein [Rhodopirellula sallentina]|uniref:FecR protein domain protein n=1 Tax=Rhodopirellula sallentina SM41 TaxID=1263870 RepID=M5U4R2_9BACT|nr:hypothetical protein [Rhodopirellula sallentina]EMI56440.1 hypothetical protein RSSM_02136 [Rhodopirellula sallentina SM41]